MVINPPAPKVPRRDSLGVEATGQICQTGAASDVGPYSPGRRCQKVRETVVICTFSDRPNIGQMHRPDPTWPQHWPDLGSRPASKTALGQLQPNMTKQRQLGLQLGSR
jgi:hypothetical protein